MTVNKLSAYQSKRDFTRTERAARGGRGAAVQAPALRHPEARRDPAALRSAPRARRRVQVLGGDPGPVARPARQAARRRGRGPSARLRRFRRDHPEGPVRRRHRAALGPRLLGAGGHDGRGRGCAKGDLKFTLEGERLHGSWVLVRMKSDRDRRQADQLAADQAPGRACAREGEARRCWREDRSVASGRRMDGDRRRQGPGAEAVHDAGGRARPAPDAVWDSKRGRTPPPARAEATPATQSGPRAKAEAAAAMPEFIEPQLCHPSSVRPAATAGCMRSSSTATACSCASRPAQAALRTRKGLDWTPKFGAIAEAGARPAGLHHRRRDRGARRSMARPISRRCRRRCPTGKTDELVLLRLRPAARRRTRTCARCRCPSARSGCGRCWPGTARPLIRYVDHFETGGDAVLQSACRMSLEGIVSKRLRRAVSLGPRRDLGQGEVPRRPRGGDRRLDRRPAASFRSLLVGVYRGDHFVYVGRVGTGFGAGEGARRCCRG